MLNSLWNPNIILGGALTAMALILIAIRGRDELPSAGASDFRDPGESLKGNNADGTHTENGFMRRSGKPRIRPTPEEIARMRLEKERDEIVATLSAMEASGLGVRHPTVVSTSRILAGIEESLKAVPSPHRAGVGESPRTAEGKSLRAQRDEVAAKLADLKRSGLGPQHPSILSSSKLLAEIEARLDAKPGSKR